MALSLIVFIYCEIEENETHKIVGDIEITKTWSDKTNNNIIDKKHNKQFEINKICPFISIEKTSTLCYPSIFGVKHIP